MGIEDAKTMHQRFTISVIIDTNTDTTDLGKFAHDLIVLIP